MLLSSYRTVEPSYFETLGIQVEVSADALGRGRAFVDRSLAADLWRGSPIGSQVESGFAGVLQVSGVVGEVREWDQEQSARTIYAAFGETDRIPARMFLLAKVNGDLAGAGRAVQDALATIDPLLPVDQQPLAGLAAESLRSRRVLTVVATGFTGVAVLLACAGTYAMVLFAVRRRFREAAIRLALGGAPAQVRRHFMRVGSVPAAIGIVIGAALTRPTAGLVSAQLFRVSPKDPAVLLTAVCALSLAAILAAVLPSRRAARADPAVLLRDD
jgi:ABC-type antimicrobial peptide transport system permease subunit